MGTAYTAASVRGVTPTTKNYIFYSQRNGELGLRIMVTCLEVNQMLFCNIYIKLHGVGIRSFQNTFQNLIHSQTQHFTESGMLHISI